MKKAVFSHLLQNVQTFYSIPVFYKAFYRFFLANFAYGGLDLDLSQFLLLPKLPPKA